MNERLARVRAVIDAASRVRHDPALASELEQTTGLSIEGVRLALDEHLELSPTDAELDALLAAAPEAPRVHVILSANVFVAALRALALARAASSEVTVRPSSREPAFARALVRALDVSTVRLEDALPASGEVHVYGRDETIASIRTSVGRGVLVRGHGTGMGVAVVEADADLKSCARALARDVVPFDQRGCLSPRVAFVLGAQRAERFAQELDDALDDAEGLVPRGRLDASELEELERWASTIAYAGELRRGPARAVGLSDSVLVPPPGRHVHVVSVAHVEALLEALSPLARWVVALGASDVKRARAWAPAHARVSSLGQMQHPALDGPVDGR